MIELILLALALVGWGVTYVHYMRSVQRLQRWLREMHLCWGKSLNNLNIAWLYHIDGLDVPPLVWSEHPKVRTYRRMADQFYIDLQLWRGRLK